MPRLTQAVVNRLLKHVAKVILSEMERQELSKADMARRMKLSPPNITQYLNGVRNMELITLADFASALGYEVRVVLKPLVRGKAHANSMLDEPHVVDGGAVSADAREVRQYAGGVYRGQGVDGPADQGV